MALTLTLTPTPNQASFGAALGEALATNTALTELDLGANRGLG